MATPTPAMHAARTASTVLAENGPPIRTRCVFAATRERPGVHCMKLKARAPPQILCRGGFSAACDVIGRCNKGKGIVGDPCRYHVRRLHFRHANGHVQSCRRNVDDAVAQRQIDAERGVVGDQPGHDRHNDGMADHIRSCNFQDAGEAGGAGREGVERRIANFDERRRVGQKGGPPRKSVKGTASCDGIGARPTRLRGRPTCG